MNDDTARGATLSPTHVERLERRLAKLEVLAEAVQRAAIRDHNVYGEIPDEDWLAIDRADIARILGALAAIDRWNPWATALERRLGNV